MIRTRFSPVSVSIRGRLGGGTLLLALLAFSPGCSRTETRDEGSASPEARVEIRTAGDGLVIGTRQAEFEIRKSGRIRAFLLTNGQRLTLDNPPPASEGEGAYSFDLAGARRMPVSSAIGERGLRLETIGKAAGNPVERVLTLEVYEDFPTLLIQGEAYRNTGASPLKIDQVVLQPHVLDMSLFPGQSIEKGLWSFHGSSLEWGKDEVVKLTKGFQQENPMNAMLPSGWGGGVPLVAFWNERMGMAIGHIEPVPQVLSIPVKVRPDGRVDASINLQPGIECKPGGSFPMPRTFISVFAGDFYEPLRIYSQILARQTEKLPPPSPEAYQMAWCGWGYEFDVTPAQMTGTIPKLKELGIRWATLDDRWFQNYGDWEPRTDTFPGDSIRRMVDAFHREGLLVQLWWLVLGVEAGENGYGPHRYVRSKVVQEHPDWLILTPAGKRARMVRDLAILCPALPEVQEYYRTLTTKFVREWGFDGHKLDVAFTVPPCYNPRHHHASPEESVQAIGKVFEVIYRTTRSLKSDSVTQICPCGAPPNAAWLPYMDQAVTADPVGPVQIRRRIKMYKALLGPRAAVYGDHVELSEMKKEGGSWVEVGEDFASTVGVGGVPGTKFTWPDYGPKYRRVFLTPEKEAHWKKWTSLYNSMMLSQGEFRNLYRTGCEVPEAYAIQKDGNQYYAFFAPEPGTVWKGQVELRGLTAGVVYHLRDYENNRPLPDVSGPTGHLSVEVKHHLLLEAKP